MNENKTRYKLLFVGPAQVGKTTLMCGWYRLAKESFQAEAVPDYEQTRQFVGVFERYLEGTPVDPTEKGVVTKVLLDCKYLERRFELELQDYSGEDILRAANNSWQDGAAENPVAESLIRDLRSADQIIAVQDPERLLGSDAGTIFDALNFLRILPRVIFNGEVGPVENVVLYLSKGDIYTEKRLEPVISTIREVADNSDICRFEIRRGSPFPTKRGKKPKSAHEFDKFFAISMAKLLGLPPIPPPPPPPWWQWLVNKLKMPGLVLLCALALYATSNLFGFSGSKAFGKLSEKVSLFEQQCQDCSDDKKQSELKSEGKQLSEEIEKERLTDSQKSELSGRVKSSLERFQDEAPQTVQGVEEVEREIKQLVSKHKVGSIVSLEPFYKELVEVSRKKTGEPGWGETAKREWISVNEFASTILSQGVEVRFVFAHFSGPQWWTTPLGYDDTKLEIWPTDGNKPFTRSTTSNAPVFTNWADSEKSLAGLFSCRWTRVSDDCPAMFRVRISDSLWMRVVESELANETLFDYLVPKTGPLGLSSLDRPLPVFFEGKNYEFQVRLDAVESIPLSVRNAFK